MHNLPVAKGSVCRRFGSGCSMSSGALSLFPLQFPLVGMFLHTYNYFSNESWHSFSLKNVFTKIGICLAVCQIVYLW